VGRLALAWGGLVAIDLVSRGSYLGPRLQTVRGLVNYVVACAVLFAVVRLAAMLERRWRLLAFAVFIVFPMCVEYSMFRGFGQFLETSDFVAAVAAPSVVFRAAGAGLEPAAAMVFALAMACAFVLPREARPLRRAPFVAVIVSVMVAIAVGATWWRAAPSLEHPQPAFTVALAGLARTAATRSKQTRRVVIPEARSDDRLPNLVLVMGESLAASHLSVYGYARDTTPRLRALADAGAMIVFRDAVVMGPHTRTSVPYIVTGLAGPDPKGRVFGAPNVLEYARARGYHTAYVSAQDESWGDLDSILRPGADTFRTGLAFAADVDVLKGSDDLVVLERGVLPTLRSIPEPFVVIVHMDGSHVPYAKHSPPSHKIWPEDGANSIEAYDNTVRVTDEYVARVFEALRARDPKAYLFFTSDHGQALGEGGAFYHRGYQSNVVRDPLLVFPPEDDARLAKLAEMPVSACDLAPTMLHLMGARPAAPMDCVDWLGAIPADRSRVVSAYTPAFLAEPTMLVLGPDGHRALYDLWRGTVVTDDGTLRPMADVPMPPDVRARLDAR
jgi:glucan phosphoethanolaminetransferase (alkaline phosphatase superfamily)